MASPFFRTLRALENEPPPRRRLAFAMGALAVWAGWMHFARVEVYASSSDARLEAREKPSRAAAAEAGRVVALHVELGRTVRPGDALVELDRAVEEQRLAEARAHTRTVERKIVALEKQIATERERRAAHWRLNTVGAQQADLGVREADQAKQQRERLAEMSKKLSEAALLSRGDLWKAEDEVADSRLKVDSASIERSRQNATRDYDDRTEESRIAELSRQVTELLAEHDVSVAAADTASAALERRTVRAAIGGHLGSIAALQVGDVLKAGDAVATVVPEGELHVVAQFAPSDAVGRVLPGQRARVKLKGFAWTQFGMLDAEVSDVANEPQGGTVRTELRLRSPDGSRVPLQHGLPGEVEIEVERVSPLQLLARTLGASPAPAPSTRAPGDLVAGKGEP